MLEGTPAPPKSRFVAEVDQVPADGASRARVRLSLADALGVAVAQKNVLFVANANVMLFQPSATDANGEAVAYLSSRIADEVTVGVQLSDGNVWTQLPQTVQVRFYAANANDANALVLELTTQGDNAVANGNQPITLHLVATETGTRPLAGSAVILDALQPNVVLEPKAGVISSLGTFTAQVRSTVAGPLVVRARVQETATTTELNFVPGPFDPNASHFTSDTNTIGADGASLAAVTFLAHDAFHNAIAGLRVKFSTDRPEDRVLADATVTNATGACSAAVTSTSLGMAMVRAEVFGAELSLPLRVVAAEPSVLFSRIDAPDTTVQADGISAVSLSVTVVDAKQRPIMGSPVLVASTDDADVFVPQTGVTDANGLFITQMRSQRAGAKSILAAFGNGYIGTSATFLPLNADPTRSSFFASPSLAAASRKPTVKLLLQARDIYGNPAAFEPVSLLATGAGVVVPKLGQTDGNGLFTALVSAPTVGNVLVTASLRSTSLNTAVSFVAGNPNLTASRLTLDPNALPADGVSRSTLVAYFVDGLGNEVDDCNVVFGTDLAGTTLTTSTPLPLAPGTAATSIISSIAGTGLVTARCGDTVISAPMNFVPGPVSFARSTLTALPAVGVADGNSLVTVVVRPRDALNNPTVGQTLSVLDVDPGAQLVLNGNNVVSPDGMLTLRLRASVPGVHTVRAVVGGVELALAVPFVAAGPSIDTSTFAVEPNVVRADGLSVARLTASVRDASGNPVVNQPVTFAASGANNLFGAAAVLTDAYGAAVALLASPRAEVKRVSAQAGNVTLSGNVSFVPSSPSALRSSLTVATQPSWTVSNLATAIADGSPRITVRVRLADDVGNPVPNVAVNLQSDTAGDVLSVLSTMTNAAGEVLATFGSGVAGRRTLRATAGSLTLTGGVNLVAGAIDANTSTLEALTDNVVADGVAPVGLRVVLRDTQGNLAAGQPISWRTEGPQAAVTDVFAAMDAMSSTTGAGRAELRAVRAGTRLVVAQLQSFVLRQNVTFIAGPALPVASNISFVPPIGVADGNSSVSASLALRDAFGNPVCGTPVDVDSSVASDVVVAANPTSDANGTFTFSVRGRTVGVHALSLQAGTATWRAPLPFVSGPPAAGSRLSLEPNVVGVDDVGSARVRVAVVDALGNPVTNANVTLATAGLGDLASTQGTTSADGTWVTSLDSTLAGLAEVTAKLSAPGSSNVALTLQQQMVFVPGPPDTAHLGARIRPYPPRAGQTVTGTFTVSDMYNNRIPGALVSLSSSVPDDDIGPALGVTDANGVFIGTGSATSVGLRYITVAVGGTSQTLPLFVLPDLATAANSTLTVQPDTVIANGLDFAAITVTARDAYGNPAANQRVDFSGDGNLQPQPSSHVTDALGVATAVLRSTVSTQQTVRASLGNEVLTAPVRFIGGPASLAHSTLQLAPASVVADGNAAASLTVMLGDARGNPAAGRPVGVVAASGLSVVDPAGGVTDANGVFVAVVHSTFAHPELVTVQADALTLAGNVSFSAGAPDAAHTTLTALPSTLAADAAGGARLVLTVADATGNPVGNVPVRFVAPNGVPAISPNATVTNATGVALADWIPGRAGTYALSAGVGSPQAFVLSSNVTVVPGALSAAGSVLTVTGGAPVADGNGAVVLQVALVDGKSNALAGENVHFEVTGGNDVLGLTDGVTDVNGIFSTQLTSYTAGPKLIVARARNIALPGAATFVPGPPSAAFSAVSFSLQTPVADGRTPLALTASVRDATNNPVVGQSVTLQSNGVGDVLSPNSCTTSSAGTCSVALVASVAGARTVQATVGGAGGLVLSVTVPFAAGSLDNLASTLTLSPNVAVADGVASVGVRIDARDAYGNPVGNVPVMLQAQGQNYTLQPNSGFSDANGAFVAQLRSTVAGPKAVAASFGGASLVANAWFVAGALDANATTLAASTGQVTADGASFALLTFNAHDRFGNAVAEVEVDFAALGGNAFVVPIRTTTDAQGLANAKVTATAAGLLQLQAQAAGNSFQVPVAFVAGAATAGTSTVALQPNVVAAGVPATLTLTLRDPLGNPVAGQPVALSSTGGNVTVVPGSAVTDANGLWAASVSSTRAQILPLVAQAGTAQLTASLSVLAAAADAVRSTLSATPNTIVANGVAAVALVTTLRDAYGNPVPASQVSFGTNGTGTVLTPNTNFTGPTGVAESALVGFVAGERQVTASCGDVVLQQNVRLEAGVPTDGTMTLTASPNVAVADGQDALALTLVVRDAQNNVVGGQNVLFVVGGSGGALLADAATDANGVAHATLRATVAENKRVIATALGARVGLDVSFVPGPPAVSSSSFVALPNTQLADGASASTLVLQLRDAAYNPVANANVSWTQVGPGVLDGPGATTDVFGQALARLTSSMAGNTTISTLGGALSANVAFHPGPASAAASSFALTPNVAIAGAPVRLALTLRDALGNPVIGQAVALAVGGGSATSVPDGAVTDANGQWSATLTATATVSLTLSAQAGAAQITALLPVQAAALDATHSSLTLSHNVVVANGIDPADVTAQLRDAFNNPVVGANVTFTTDAPGSSVTPPASVTDIFGSASSVLVGTVAGPGVVHAQSGNLALQQNIQFIAGSASDQTVALTASPNLAVADGVGTVALVLSVKDPQGNPVVSAAVDFVVTGLGNQLQADAVTDANGLARATLKSTVAGAKRVTAGAQNAHAATNVAFVAGAPSAATSSLNPVPPSQLADGNAPVAFLLVLRDAQSNPVPGATVTWTVQGVGTLAAPSATTDAAGLAQAQLTSRAAGVGQVSTLAGALAANATFLAGPASVATSSLALQPSTPTAGAPAIVVVVLRDAQGNPVVGQAVTLGVGGGNALLAVNTNVTDANGLWTTTLVSNRVQSSTLTAQAGTAQLTAPLTVQAAAPDASRSTLALAPNVLVANGVSAADATATLRDAFDNPVPGVTVSFATPTLGGTVTPPNAVTSAAGRASASLAGVVAGPALLSASAGNVVLQANALLVAGAPTSGTVTLTAAPNPALADGQAVVVLRLRVRDALNNPVTGQAISFSAGGSGGNLLADAATDANGVAQAWLRSTVAETKKVTAGLPNANASANVTFLPGPPVAGNSTYVALQTNLLADGNAAATFVLTLRDALQNPVVGSPVSFTLTGPGTLGMPPTTTDAEGRAQVSLTSTQTGTSRVTTLGGALFAEATFVPGAVDSTRATWTASPNVVVADGVAATVLTLRLADAQNNPLPGQSVMFGGSSPNDLWSIGVTTTDAQGNANTVLRSTAAGIRAYTATAAGTSFVTSVQFRAGAADANSSSLLVLPPAVAADGNARSALIVMAFDAQKNSVANASVAFASTGANVAISPLNATTDATGLATAAIFSTTAQSANVTARLTAGSANFTLAGNVTFLSGAPSPTQAALHLDPNVVVADGVAASAVRVRLLDAFGNPVVGRGVTPVFGAPATCTPPSGVTDANGCFTCAAHSLLASVTPVTVDIGAGALTGNLSFVAGPATSGTSSLVASPNLLVADDAHTTMVTLRLRDAQNNPVAQQNVVWSTDASPPSSATLSASANATNVAGLATVALQGRRAGTVNVTATAGGNVVLQVPVSFFAGAASGAQTMLVATPNRIVADGVGAAQLVASVRDVFGNPVAGQTVTLAVSAGAGLTGLPTAGVTDANGQYATSARSTVAQARTVTLTAGAAQATTQLSVVAGSPNQTSSVLVGPAVPVIADGVSTAGFTVTVRDALNNPVGNVPVGFAVNSPNAALAPTSAPTNAAGVATSALSSAQAGNYLMTASFGGLSLAANATLVAASPNMTASQLVCSPNVVVANGAASANCVLLARDARGNPVTGQAVAITADQPAVALQPAAGATGPDGSFSFVATDLVAQTTTITGNLGTAAPTTQVRFVAGPVDGNTSTFTVNPNQGVGNGNSQLALVVTLRDTFNNRVPFAPVSLSSSGTGGAFTVSSGNATQFGMFNAALSSSVAETKLLQATSGSVTLNAQAKFIPGAVSASRSVLVISPNVVVADGNAACTLALVAKDTSGNLVGAQTVTLASSGGNNAFAPSNGNTDVAGSFSAALRSTTAETKSLTVTVGGTAIAASVQFVAGAPSASTSTLVADRSSITADGASQAGLTLSVRDVFGNPVVGQAVTFSGAGAGGNFTVTGGNTTVAGTLQTALSSTVAAAKAIRATFGGAFLELPINFVPGPLAAATSTLTSDVNTIVADGISKASLQVLLRDAQSNALAGQAISFTSSSPNTSFVPSGGVSDANGRLSAVYAGTTAGASSVTAQSGAVALRVDVALTPGPANANASSFALSPTTLAADGVSTSVATLRLRDAQNNPVAQQNVLLTPADPNDAWSPPTGKTAADGTFVASLASPRAGAHSVTAQAANLTFAGSANFVAGAPSATNSQLTLSPNAAVADGNAQVAVALALRDSWNNPVGAQNVVFAAIGANVTLSHNAGVTNVAGTLGAQLASTRAEVKRVTATAGGLVLMANATFVSGPANVTQSSLTLSPNVVVADGASFAAATLSLRDAYANPVVDQAVSFAAQGNGVALATPSATTDAAGAANTLVRSTLAQQANVTIAVAGLNYAATVRFVAGPVSAVGTAINLNPNRPVIADNNDVATLVVNVADAQGNPVAGQNVIFSGLGDAITFSPLSVLSDANGLAVSLVSSPRAAIKSLRATLGTAAGAPTLNRVAVFVPGPPSATTSTLVASPNVVTADGNTAALLTVLAQDACGNLVGGANVTVAASGANNTLAATSGFTATDGTFTTTLRSTRAQAQNVQVTIGGAGGPVLVVPVLFKPGEPSTARSTLVVAPPSFIASATDNANVNLVLLDQQNNPVPSVAVTFASPMVNGTLSSPSGTTDANGKLTVRLRSTLVQTSFVQAGFGSASLQQNFVVTGAPPSSLTSQVTAAPSTVVADGISTIGLSVAVKDAFGNLLSGVPLTLAGSGGNNVFGATSGNTTAGTFTTQLSSTLAQQQNVIVSAGAVSPAIFSTQVAFTPGAPTAGRTTFVASPNVFVANNVATSVLTTTVRDAFGNPVPNQNVVVGISGTNLNVSATSGPTNAAGNFATTVRTTLAQPLSATSGVNGVYALSANLVAVPGPTSQLIVAGLAGGTAAVTSVPQVVARDAFSNITPAFTGTVAFSSTDPVAVLPAPYAFTSGDAGSRLWPTGVTLVTPGTHTVTASVVETPAVTGSQNNLVVSAPLFASATLTSQALGSSCLDLRNGTPAAGTPLQASTCTNLAAEVFAFGTDGTVRVLGSCVAVFDGSFAAGQPVVSAACNGAPSQRWSLSASGQLVSVGNPNYCLDLQSATSGTAAVINTCGAGSGQAFTVRSVAPRYALVSGALQQVVEVTGGSSVAGAGLQNNAMANSVTQGFTFATDGTLRSGALCVQPAGGSAAAGANVVLAACSGTPAQQFALSGNVVQSGADATLCLDVGVSVTPRAVKLQTCTGGASQILGAAVQAQVYRYLNYSGLNTPICLDVTAALNAGMPPVMANTCSLTTAQVWALNPGASTNVTFGLNCLDTQVGLLNLLGLATYNGQQLYANTCSTSVTQNWRAQPTSSSTYQLKWLATGNYCASSSPTVGNNAQLGTCNTVNTNQMFAQLAQSSVLKATTAPTLCLEVAGNLPVAGAAVRFNPCATSLAQSFTPSVDGSVQFNDQCLDVPDGLAVGSAVRLAPCTGSATQKWTTVSSATTASVVTVRSTTTTTLCLDPSAAAAGQPLRLATCSGANAQTFAAF